MQKGNKGGKGAGAVEGQHPPRHLPIWALLAPPRQRPTQTKFSAPPSHPGPWRAEARPTPAGRLQMPQISFYLRCPRQDPCDVLLLQAAPGGAELGAVAVDGQVRGGDHHGAVVLEPCTAWETDFRPKTTVLLTCRYRGRASMPLVVSLDDAQGTSTSSHSPLPSRFRMMLAGRGTHRARCSS